MSNTMNLLDNAPNQTSKFLTELKKIMTHVERITLIVKLNLKLYIT